MKKYLPIISFVMMAGETQMTGAKGLLIQIIWSSLWGYIFYRSSYAAWKDYQG